MESTLVQSVSYCSRYVLAPRSRIVISGIDGMMHRLIVIGRHRKRQQARVISDNVDWKYRQILARDQTM